MRLHEAVGGLLTSPWLWMPLTALGVLVVVAVGVLIGAVMAYAAAYLTGRTDL